MTVICGSSWAVAGLFGGDPDGSAAGAEIEIAAAARNINSPNCRMGLECANSVPVTHARGGLAATGVMGRDLFLIAWNAPTAHGQPLDGA